MDLEAEFKRIARQMYLDFERARSLSRHPYLKGDSAESIVRTFLTMYLPANLEISSGHIFDTQGNMSNQLDIIISDKIATPSFYSDPEHRTRLIPVESVYSVIEVKFFLDKTALTKKRSGVFVNMESVRRLKKKAFYSSGVIKRPTDNYGQEWEDWPINYFVFAFNSIRLETLRDHIENYHIAHKLPPEKRIDSVCILGKGVITNERDSGVDACPDLTSRLKYCYTTKELLLFYTLISHYLLQATSRPLRFADYLKNIDLFS